MSRDGTAPDEAPLDVLIVGAGLAGIGMACRLRRAHPRLSVAIVEARARLGGTWDLFRYPGVRADSDLYTLGYAFRPWRGPVAVADGAAILDYLRDTAEAHGVDRLVRYGHAVRHASWSGADRCWTVNLARRTADDAEPSDTLTLRARFLVACTGYYRYDRAHRPVFDGEAEFRGTVVHPQFWPDGLDVSGRRVVVVGSGATAVSLVPALAERAASVTMLQRSPSYVVARPARDPLAGWLHRALPARAAGAVLRWKYLALGGGLYRAARRWPGPVGRYLANAAADAAGARGDARSHFAPRYGPWDQRLCLAPDGDFFRSLRSGRATLLTDRIERFVPEGLRLASGRTLEADLVVLATGLELGVLGGATLAVDGRPVDAGKALVYRGAMLADVPNFAFAFGYANASWTLRADLTARWVCRLLRAMARRGASVVVAPAEPAVEARPLLPLSSGYVQRAAGVLPKQGTSGPWRVFQSHLRDRIAARGRIADGVLRFDP